MNKKEIKSGNMIINILLFCFSGILLNILLICSGFNHDNIIHFNILFAIIFPKKIKFYI